MRIVSRVLAVVVIAAFLHVSGARACDLTDINSVDAIDGVFPPVFGSITASISGQEDESWMVFNAFAGEIVTFTYQSSADGGGNNLVTAILQETDNGVVEVGDTLGIANWNPNNFGITSGQFTVISADDNSDGGNAWPDDGTITTQIVTIPADGQYAVVTAMCNSDNVPPSTITIQIEGNAVVPVPTVDPWAIFGLLGALSLAGVVALKRF